MSWVSSWPQDITATVSSLVSSLLAATEDICEDTSRAEGSGPPVTLRRLYRVILSLMLY